MKEKDNINYIQTLLKVKGVAFDLDETLLSRTQAFTQLLSDWKQEALMQSVLGEILERDQNGYGDRIAFFQWLSDFLRLELSAQDLMLKFRRELPNHITRENHSIQLLEFLKEKGKVTGILTNGGAELQRAKLNKSEIGAVEERVIISGDYDFKKPEQAIFQLLCKRMEVEPDEILFIGDHYENDAMGACQAGLIPGWLRKGRKVPENIPNDLLIFDSIEEVVEICKRVL